MTRDDEIKVFLKYVRQKTKEWVADPEKARQYLIKVGILDKTGKRLARKYR